jgi:hypothetical protein
MPSHAPGKIGETGVLSELIFVVGFDVDRTAASDHLVRAAAGGATNSIANIV